MINRKKTKWSHSDGDAPWNRNYRTPVEDIGKDTTVAIFEALPKAFIDEFYGYEPDKEYEPDERIRGQFE